MGRGGGHSLVQIQGESASQFSLCWGWILEQQEVATEQGANQIYNQHYIIIVVKSLFQIASLHLIKMQQVGISYFIQIFGNLGTCQTNACAHLVNLFRLDSSELLTSLSLMSLNRLWNHFVWFISTYVNISCYSYFCITFTIPV